MPEPTQLPPPAAARARPPVVRSIPHHHPYVRSALPGRDHGIELAADPVLDPTDPDRWWPHPALEPGWVDPADPDLVHVHFGYEHRTPAELRELVAGWRAGGRRLVVTVHDLHNPHEADPATHLERTEVLVRGADAVITLTRTAAARIEERWDVRPEVIAHPPILDPASVHRVRTAPRGAVLRHVAVFPKIGRANCDPYTAMSALAAVTRRTPGLTAHAFVPGHPGGVVDAARDLGWGRHPRLRLHSGDGLSDEALHTWLTRLDLVVLPYLFGTHSGWIELCRDLGLAVVVPGCGAYVDQAGDMRSAHYPVGDRAGLESALTSLVDSTRPEPEHPGRAGSRRAACRSRHLSVYRRVLGRPAPELPARHPRTRDAG